MPVMKEIEVVKFLRLTAVLGVFLAAGAHAEWLMVHIADSRGKPTGDKAASISAELPTAGECKFTIRGNRSSVIKCKYFNLSKGIFKGGRHWNIEMKVGGEMSTVKMRELGRSAAGFIPTGGIFAVDPTARIIAAATDPQDVLVLSIPYYNLGIVELRFPLEGLAEALEGSGIVESTSPDGTARDPYCRLEDVLEPGDSCNIYDTNVDFWVNSSGQGCIVGRGLRSARVDTWTIATRA